MILGTEKIQERLEEGQIFRKPSWDCRNVKEASYALRAAKDGMVVDGKVYRPGTYYPDPIVQIKPGHVAILSTEERLCMPCDLVGKLGVRLDFASRGLAGLMGIQVDPYYGADSPDERLFIKVANFGNEIVEVNPGDAVFNIEFSEVEKAAKPDPPKRPTWDRLLEELVNRQHSEWTLVARVQTEFDARADELESKISRDLSETSAHQQRELDGIRNKPTISRDVRRLFGGDYDTFSIRRGHPQCKRRPYVDGARGLDIFVGLLWDCYYRDRGVHRVRRLGILDVNPRDFP